MAISGVGDYGGIYESAYASLKKETDVSGRKRTDGANEPLKSSEGKTEAANKAVSNQKYLAKLQQKVSYVKLEIGSGLSMKKDNKVGTIAINPKLLEKMQNNPEAEEKYTQMIKDIERAEKTVAAYYNAMGGCVEHTSHWYIDENGKYYHFGYVYRDDKLNKKLREDAQENAGKLIEKTRENAREKKEQLEEKLEEKAEAAPVKKSKSTNFDIKI